MMSPDAPLAAGWARSSAKHRWHVVYSSGTAYCGAPIGAQREESGSDPARAGCCSVCAIRLDNERSRSVREADKALARQIKAGGTLNQLTLAF